MPSGACGKCDINFKRSNDPAIECDCCKQWYHIPCTPVSNDIVKAITESNKDKKRKKGLKWFCELCDGTVSELLTNFQKYKKVDIEIKKYKDEIEGKIQELDRRMAKCETGNVNTENLVQRVETAEQRLENNPTISDLQEKQDIESRKNNLVFFGLPEVDSDDVEERLELEYSMIETALTDKTELDIEEVKDFFRLGKKSEDKKRPILMRFQSEETKMAVLKASRDLSLKIDDEEHKIHVSNDLTAKQRNYIKTLKEELKTRRDRGEEDLVIRGNKIVKKQLFFEQQRSKTRIIWATIRKKKAEAGENEEPK